MNETVCEECNCSYKDHQHIVYECIKVKKSIISPEQQKRIDTEQAAIDCINDILQKTKQLNKELNEEIQIIQDISATFAVILKKYSITVSF